MNTINKVVIESRLISGGAFVGDHSFSKILARNRPDAQDMSGVSEFARQIY